jgi:hypothetical protein
MTRYRFVPHLDDLIHPSEYADDPQGRRVRLKIAVGPEGIRIHGDAMCVRNIEELLDFLEPEVIAQMLCG